MRADLSALPFLLNAPAQAQRNAIVDYQQPVSLSDGWKTAGAESLGVDPNRLAALTRAIRAWPELGVHAILIERAGHLIYEGYFDGFDERAWSPPLGKRSMARDSLHDIRSVTKSVVSALIGIAIGAGAIRSLDQPVIDWFPEFPELRTAERRRITLAHALTMTGGLAWNEEVPYTTRSNDEMRMTADAQPLRYALSRPVASAPGSTFNYSGGMTHVVAAVLARATKTPLVEYARSQLFAPLDIASFEWLGDLAGMPAAASRIRLRPRDLAKFGSLYLHAGTWNGAQVIPARWIEESTRRHVRLGPPFGPTFPGDFGYGYFWWYGCQTSPVGQIEVRAAVGNGQQRVFVLPGLEIVVTILAGRYNDFTTGSTLGPRILMDHVVPAVRTGVRAGCPGA